VDDSHDDAADSTITRALGDELRRARESVGLTRADLIARMPTEIHSQTLASYERGVRQCTVGRLAEICQAMGVSAPDLLRWAMQRAELDLPVIGIQIDLHAVISDKRKELDPLRRWAGDRLSEDSGSGHFHLEWPVILEMGRLFGIARAQFVSYLISFTPYPTARRR
jgi:transcriptional regulator with XRE-family HTH domain